LFVRARLKDGDMVEGLAANDVSLVSSEGVFLTPPDLRSNTQRLWIPRSSLEELDVGRGDWGGEAEAGGGGERCARRAGRAV